ncbi:Protein trichome birefringence-like 45 [Raphanus sativus]|uniref:Protein trichome birefringence-like 45 n=1 Tax=Raphanus sativus TaxID=3726 RepID=A0A6J0JGE3_RAPSA|nr:protein trichome birefringence-like 45 [Raphanus sativus]KAJ4891302.1 Protein trichome birefringence-like 45 [Raphanus sativus]
MSALQCLTFLFLFLFLLQDATSASPLPLRRRPVHNNSTHSNFAKHPRRRVVFPVNRSSCDLFAGEWVRDETYPLYRTEECGKGMIDPGFDCQTYGRPDSDYLKFRWKPFNCDVPRFNGVKFLQKMRNKTVMFVGDSLGRNQWESLMCMISSSAPFIRTNLIHEDPLSTFKILDYNVKVSFYRAPYLVDIEKIHGKTTLKLDEISVDASDAWRTADVLLFNTGHWWSHTGSLRGWEQMETGGRYYGDMDRLVALTKGLRTWSNWVIRYTKSPLTRVFFLSVSPTHYNPNEWTSRAKASTIAQGGKSCYGQTTPFSGTTYPTNSYVNQKKVIDEVVKEMNSHVSLMDISMLSALRIDGHPSIYSGDLNPSLKRFPDRSSDCSHWCLPGLPDTWNQLFYAALLL